MLWDMSGINAMAKEEKKAMVEDFKISLSESKEFYVPGETISGVLHYALDEPNSYKKVEIVFNGGAEVKWSEERVYSFGIYTCTQIVTLEAKEVYTNQSKVLWRCEQTPDGKIGPGSFDKQFQFVIPDTCLGSFPSYNCYGSISYSLRAHIKTGLLHRDHMIEVPIILRRIVNINVPHLMVPTHETKEIMVGFFPFRSKIKFTASLNRTGFCIGLNLPLTVSVLNGSSRQIKMRASIKRYCTFHAQGHTLSSKQLVNPRLVTIVSPNIAAHSQYTWNVEDLIVPMVETSFKESRIIKMQYILKVTAVIPWALNSSVKIPITLGNAPLNNDM